LFSGRFSDISIEAGLVAGGEGAALEFQEWRRGIFQCLRRIDGALMGIWEDMIFAEFVVTATSDR
jgi:hypothetical protein